MITKKDLMLCEKMTEEEIPNLVGEYKANIKYDGERLAIIKHGEDVFLLNRAGREKSFIYPEIYEDFKKVKGDFVLDGEVLTTDELFNTLQHRSNLGKREKIEEAKTKYPIKYVAFDILFFANEDLRNKPLKQRVEYLNGFKNEVKDLRIEIVEYGEIKEMLDRAKANDGEGILVKNMNGFYEGRRSKNWLKLKLFKNTDLRISSYTINNAGIRCEDIYENAVQISGNQHYEVKDIIDKIGYADIVVQYLEKTKNGRLRFISYVGLK